MSSASNAPPHITWEIALVSLLAVLLEAERARVAWFEREDARKARKIDELLAEHVHERRAA